MSLKFLALKHNGQRVSGSAMLDSDPDAYRFLDWHFKVMCWINAEHGFSVAGPYHKEIMRRVNEDDFDAAQYYESPACYAGRIEDCLVEATFYKAVLLARPTPRAGAVAATRATVKAGTTDKVKPTDTYCEHHKKWYPASAADPHTSATCRWHKSRG